MGILGTLLMIWGFVVLWDVRLKVYFYRMFDETGVVIFVGVVILFVGIVLYLLEYLFELTIPRTSGVPDVEPVETFHNNGQLRVKGTYKDGDWDGPFEHYYENGELMEKGTYKDGKKCGEWLEFGGETVTHPPC